MSACSTHDASQSCLTNYQNRDPESYITLFSLHEPENKHNVLFIYFLFPTDYSTGPVGHRSCSTYPATLPTLQVPDLIRIGIQSLLPFILRWWVFLRILPGLLWCSLSLLRKQAEIPLLPRLPCRLRWLLLWWLARQLQTPAESIQIWSSGTYTLLHMYARRIKCTIEGMERKVIGL